MPRATRRDDVLAAADRRFALDGIRATGVDTVIADAGVAKMTLYSHFRSKDDLVVAYLEARDARTWERLDALLVDASTPLERAMTPVRLYQRSVEEDGFHGCVFVNAAAELPSTHPGRKVVRAHKRRLVERWEGLLAEAGAPRPGALAHECFLLLEGAFVQAGLGVMDPALQEVERLIRDRIADAIGGGS